MSKSKKRINIVYSTNPNFEYDATEQEEIDLDNQDQQLYVIIDRKQRKGKPVTIVQGFIGNDENLKILARDLKLKCGVGGSTKDGEILIQGEHKDKVFQLLMEKGFTKTKKR